ncbi:protein stand still-like [Drosophila innubila]|uniref:protein stand still-like n=1 Tax=Drosophila innubila TaxID=198719 RepID=UPI00148C6AC4|nr:protein stand still-like [Drosophila innubila]
MASSQLKKKQIPYILKGDIFTIKRRIGNKVFVKCTHCPSKHLIRGNLCHGTGNFHEHIKRLHPHLIDKVASMKRAKEEKVAAARISKRRKVRSSEVDVSMDNNEDCLDEEDSSSEDIDVAASKELLHYLRLVPESKEKNQIREEVQNLISQLRKIYSASLYEPI